MGKKEESQSVKDRQFERLRKGILEELLSATIYYKIVSEFLATPKTIRAIMDKSGYNVFFFYTQWAHIKLLCISLYNVTKHNEQTSNIPRLLCYIRFHKTLSKKYPVNDINVIENKLKSHSTFLEKVYDLRDKVYAHNQLNKRKIEITLGEMRDGCQLLLPDLQEIYNALSTGYDRSSVLFKTMESINITKLLTNLTEYKEMKRMDKKRYCNGKFETSHD